MLIAILILMVFQVGLMIITIGGMAMYKDEIIKHQTEQTKHTDGSIEALGDAIYNMDSIKQKVNMSGKFEI